MTSSVIQSIDGGIERRWSRLRLWLSRGTLATMDQGFISGSNFAITLLLARWLTIPGYGAYGLILTVMSLITAAHQALLLEPMSILGASDYGRCPTAYMRAMFRLNVLFSLVIAVALAGLAGGARLMHATAGLPAAFMVLAITYPATLLLAVARGGCYLKLEPAPAACGSFVYGVVTIASVFVLNLVHRISTPSVLIAMAIGAAAGVLVVMPHCKPSSRVREHGSPNTAEILRSHWLYGRWALAATPVLWIRENICYTFLGFGQGLAGIAILRAMMNPVVPALQLVNSTSRLLNPYLASQVGQQGYTGIRKSTHRLIALFGGVGTAYALGLWSCQKPLLQLLYGNRFGQSTDVFAWMGPVTLSYLILYAPLIGLRVIKAPFLVFVSYSVAALIATVVGLPLTMRYGVRGAVISLFVTNMAAAVFAVRLFWKRTRTDGQSQVLAARVGSGFSDEFGAHNAADRLIQPEV